MRLLRLVLLAVAFAGCGSITLASDEPDGSAPATSPAQRGAGGARGAAAASGPAPAPACDKMCPSGKGEAPGVGKHGDGDPCDKSPCDPGDQS
jgi:hypothetical protein